MARFNTKWRPPSDPSALQVRGLSTGCTAAAELWGAGPVQCIPERHTEVQRLGFLHGNDKWAFYH